MPDFTSIGYLPPGIHPATHEEIRQRLVFNAPPQAQPLFDLSKNEHPQRRERIFNGYEKLTTALCLVGLSGEQWLGGSFVSSRFAPEDLDLVSFCDVQAYQALTPELRTMVRQYFKGEETARHCHCDSYFAPLPPAEHQHSEDFKLVRAYWEKLLGHDTHGRAKGIVSRAVVPPSAHQETSNDAKTC